MGIEYITCAVSQLPIRPKERAVLVLLSKSPGDLDGDAGSFGGIGLWSPWSLPLVGVYNGYGILELEESWHTRFIQKRLHETVLERMEGANPFREPPVTKARIMEDTNLSKLQDLIQDNRVRVAVDVDGEEVVPLGRCMIREDVYRMLVETPLFTQDTVNTAKDAVAREMERMQSTDKSPLHTGEMKLALDQLKGTVVGDMVETTMQNLSHYLRLTEAVGSYGPTGYRGIGTYRVHIAEQVMSGVSKDHPDLLLEVKEFGEFIHFLLHFEVLRKTWKPPGALGSQTTGWGSHAALSGLVFRVARAEFDAETEKYEDPEPPTER